MRRWTAVGVAAAAVLAAGGVLGVADAQQPAPAQPAPAPPPRVITVNGGNASEVSSDASTDERRAAYRTALGAALDDARAKAQFVAERTGLVLGETQSVTEQTGSVLDGCVSFAGATAEARPLPPVRRPAKRKPKARRPAAAKPVAGTAPFAQAPDDVPPGTYRCQVVASVTVTYAVT